MDKASDKRLLNDYDNLRGSQYSQAFVSNRHCLLCLFAFAFAILILFFLAYISETENASVIKMKKFDPKWSAPFYLHRLPSNLTRRETVVHVLQLARKDKYRDFLPPLFNYKRSFIIGGKYKFGSCQIEKNLSTLLRGIFCYLWDEERFLKAKLKVTDSSNATDYCWERRDMIFHTYSRPPKDFLSNSTVRAYQKFAVIRNPVERFLSAFLNKCAYEAKLDRKLCYGCSSDMKCVLENIYMRMYSFAKGIVKLNIGYEDRHFVPQSWLCGFNEAFDEFKLVRYGNAARESEVKTINELLGIFEEHAVPQRMIDKIRNEALGTKTFHTTSSYRKRRYYEKIVQYNPYIKSLLRRIYYFDFLLFRYDPSELETI